MAWKREVMVHMQNIIWNLIVGALGMWISLTVKSERREVSDFKETLHFQIPWRVVAQMFSEA